MYLAKIKNQRYYTWPVCTDKSQRQVGIHWYNPESLANNKLLKRYPRKSLLRKKSLVAISIPYQQPYSPSLSHWIRHGCVTCHGVKRLRISNMLTFGRKSLRPMSYLSCSLDPLPATSYVPLGEALSAQMLEWGGHGIEPLQPGTEMGQEQGMKLCCFTLLERVVVVFVTTKLNLTEIKSILL